MDRRTFLKGGLILPFTQPLEVSSNMDYNTGNPVPSSDPRDLSDNAKILDNLVNADKPEHPDRLGVPRKTWHGMEEDFQSFLQSSGYQDLGDYAAGIEITARNQVVRADGELWRLSASEDLPYTTSGDWAADSGDFMAIGDAVLRQELDSNTAGQGSDLIAHTGTSDTVSEALNNRTIYVESVDSLITSTGLSGKVYVQSYYGGWAGTVAGPQGGHNVHKTGGTNTAPTVGAAVLVSTVGSGDQAGYYWDASGDEWAISRDQALSFDMLGARGNGLTDDSAAIQGAITYSDGMLTGRTGATYIAEGLLPKNNLTIYGDFTLRPPTTPSNHVIYYVNDTQLEGFNIAGDVKFRGRGKAAGYDGIHITSVTPADTTRSWYLSTVAGAKFEQFRNGIYCSNPGTVYLRECHFIGNKNGIAWDYEHFEVNHCRMDFNECGMLLGQGSPVSTGAHHFRITGCAIAHNTVAGIKGSMSSASMTANSFIDNGEAHIYVEAIFSNMRVVGNRFEGGANTNYAIDSGTIVGAQVLDSIIANNTFLLNDDTDLFGLFIGTRITSNIFKNTDNRAVACRGFDTEISGNLFKGHGMEAIYITDNIIGLNINNNDFIDSGMSSAGVYNSIDTDAVALQSSSISNNSFRNTGATQYINKAADLSSLVNAQGTIVSDNRTRNLASSQTFEFVESQITDGSLLVKGNRGYDW